MVKVPYCHSPVRNLYVVNATSVTPVKIKSPLPKLSRGVVANTLEIFSSTKEGTVGECAIIYICYVRDALLNYRANKHVGALFDAVNWVLKVSGESELVISEMRMLENTEEQRMGGTGRLLGQQTNEVRNVLNVACQKIYNLLTLNHFGLEVHING